MDGKKRRSLLEIFDKFDHISKEEDILDALFADDASEYSFGGDVDEDLNLDDTEMQDVEPPGRAMMMDPTEREVLLDLPDKEPQPEQDDIPIVGDDKEPEEVAADPDYQRDEESPDEEQGVDEETLDQHEPTTSTGSKRKKGLKDEMESKFQRKKKAMNKKKPKATQNKEQWIKTDFHPATVDVECDDSSMYVRENWTPRKYVEIFIDDDLIKMMRECTELRINMQKHSTPGTMTKSVQVKHSDMCAFVGAIILMSCLNYPRIRMYWAKVTKVSSISDKIFRNFYFQIWSNLKVVDDNLVPRHQRLDDKYWKIRPIAQRSL